MSIHDDPVISARIIRSPRKPRDCEYDEGDAGGYGTHPIRRGLTIRLTRIGRRGRLYHTYHCEAHAIAGYFDPTGQERLDRAYMAFSLRAERQVAA